jgi:hypothetical protein
VQPAWEIKALNKKKCPEIEKERKNLEDVGIGGRLLQERIFKMWHKQHKVMSLAG